MTTNCEIFKKGKRGIIYLEEKDGTKIIVKKKNPQADVDTLENEAAFLKTLNSHGIGPRLISSNSDCVKMEFIDGVFIQEYFENESKKKILEVIKKIFEQCLTMDSLGITKFEMTRPYKHIIVRKEKTKNGKDGTDIDVPVMIDFERCRKNERPKNVTQFLQFVTSKNISSILGKKGIVFQKEKVRVCAKQYKAIVSITTINKKNDVAVKQPCDFRKILAEVLKC